jgi:hypothetical protein
VFKGHFPPISDLWRLRYRLPVARLGKASFLSKDIDCNPQMGVRRGFSPYVVFLSARSSFLGTQRPTLLNRQARRRRARPLEAIVGHKP